jgi:hypothetical protein
MEHSKIVEIYRAKDAIEAALIQDALEEAGIRVRVEGGPLQVGGRMPMCWSETPRIIVFENDAARAREVVSRLPKR